MRPSDAVPAGAGQAPLPLLMLCGLFLRIGCTSFGGFMAMVSVIQNTVVERYKLLPERELLDGLALASMLPGPLAINLVAYVGYRLRGPAGAVAAVLGALLPAFVLMVALGTLYFRWGELATVGKLFMGLTPAVTALVAAAALRLCRSSVHGWREVLLTAGAAVLLIAVPGVPTTLAILAVAAAAGWCWRRAADVDQSTAARAPATGGAADLTAPSLPHAGAAMLRALALPLAAAPLIGLAAGVLPKLFCTFAGMSLLMFGGGYVFVPLLQQVVVDGQAWVTRREFVDALALSQVTPGPVMISAAFIGLKVGGLAGAAVATAGMFLPTAALMVAAVHLLDRVRHSAAVQAGLRGVRAAAAGMVIAAAMTIGMTAAPGWQSAALGVAALVALVRYRVEVVWVLPAAALMGYLFY